LADEVGFLNVGFTQASLLEPESTRLKKWLDKGYHGKMKYMENHFEKRVNPSELVPGSHSVITLAYNYYTKQKLNPESPKLSMYALGRDYHKVVRKKLKQLFHKIQDKFPGTKGRYFVDSAPILERDLAKRAGMGWIGKNTLLIHPKLGSYFFLAEIITNLSFENDQSISDHCGTCTRCIEACPTDAISPNGYELDGSKCISYLTIELKDSEIPEEFTEKMENWMYGCDICQEVCPWNRFSKEHEEEEFSPSPNLLGMTQEDWSELNEETFNTLFYGSAVKRTKFSGLKRNIDFLQ
jgi:epoxyqueuosine reductase